MFNNCVHIHCQKVNYSKYKCQKVEEIYRAR